jgi:hypothetical protein
VGIREDSNRALPRRHASRMDEDKDRALPRRRMSSEHISPATPDAPFRLARDGRLNIGQSSDLEGRVGRRQAARRQAGVP